MARHRPMARQGSHLPMLLKVFELSEGPVLELGVGAMSTPILHLLCAHTGRELVSMESDPRYVDKYQSYTDEFHKVLHVEDWSQAPLGGRHWGMVLVDHKPAGQRQFDVLRLTKSADFVLLHDSEPKYERAYRYERVYPHFKYRYDYTKLRPWTTVVSNHRDLAFLEGP